MAHLDYSPFKVFDVLYYLEKNLGLHGSAEDTALLNHVYGVFLLNAWRRRNSQIDREQKRLTRAKDKCNVNKKKMMDLTESLGKIEGQNEVLKASLFSSQFQLSISRKKYKCILSKNDLLNEECSQLYAKINDRSLALEANRKQVKTIEDELAKVRSKIEENKSKVNHTLQFTVHTLLEGDNFQAKIEQTSEEILSDLSDLSNEVDKRDKDLDREITDFLITLDKYQAAQEHFDGLLYMAKVLEERVQLAEEVSKSMANENDKQVPWLWNALMDIYSNSKRFLINVASPFYSNDFLDLHSDTISQGSVSEMDESLPRNLSAAPLIVSSLNFLNSSKTNVRS